MNRFNMGHVFLASSILMTCIAQVLLKSLVRGLDQQGGAIAIVKQLLSGQRFWLSGLIGVLMTVGLVLWAMCLGKLPLSVAFPLSCASALVVAFLSVAFLGETVTVRLWIGTILIVAGTILIAPSA